MATIADFCINFLKRPKFTFHPVLCFCREIKFMMKSRVCIFVENRPSARGVVKKNFEKKNKNVFLGGCLVKKNYFEQKTFLFRFFLTIRETN